MVASSRPQTEIRHPLVEARAIAEALVFLMSPYCERVEIAGSIRRQKGEVKDIELVLIPKATWFGFTDDLLTQGVLSKGHAWGHRYRAAVHVESRIRVDLFVADAGNFGAVLQLRTGPGECNKRLMTWLKASRASLRMHEAHWWHGDRRLLTPEESDVFALFGIDHLAPEKRTLAAWRERLNDPARQWPDFSQWYEPEPEQPAHQAQMFSAASVYGMEVAERDYKPAAARQVWPAPTRPPRLQIDLTRVRLEYGLGYNRLAYRERVGQAQRGYGRYDWPVGYREHRDYFIMQALRKGLEHSHKLDEAKDEAVVPPKGQTMLTLDLDGKLQITVNDLVGERVAVLGISGSGKSNSTAVLIEETGDYIPFVIFDDENEYWTLTERFPALVVGRTKESMIDVPVEQAGQLARFAYGRGLSVILSLNKHRKAEKLEFLNEFFEAFWQAADSAIKVQPFTIVLEECHRLIPQGGGEGLRELFELYASAGRKRGLGLVMSSQRSSKVHKDSLTSARLYLLHSVIHNADMGVYKGLVPVMKPQEIEDTVASLKPGEAIAIWQNRPQVVRMRQRTTMHPGATPTLDAQEAQPQPAVQALDETLLAELRTALGAKPETLSSSGQQAIKIAELEAEVQRLQTQLAEAQPADPPALTEERLKANNYRDALEVILKVVKEALEPGVALPEIVRINLTGASDFAQHTMEDPTWQSSNGAAPVEWDGRSDTAKKRAQDRQRRAFDKWLQEIRVLRPSQVQALVFLAERELADQWFNEKQIAYGLGLSLSTVLGRVSKLATMDVVEKQPGIEGLEYRAKLRSKFGERFPDLEPESLVKDFIGIFALSD